MEAGEAQGIFKPGYLPNPAPIKYTDPKRWQSQDLFQREKLIQSLNSDPVLNDRIASLEGLTPNEVLDVFERVSNHMAGVYDFPRPKLQLRQETTALASYSEHNHTLYINQKRLSQKPLDIKGLVNSVIHENTHAYQAWTVAKVQGGEWPHMSEIAKLWEQNFKRYISMETSKQGYLAQAIERHAYSTGDEISRQWLK
jgi:hypothetical protein